MKVFQLQKCETLAAFPELDPRDQRAAFPTRNKPKHSQGWCLMVKQTHLAGFRVLKSPEEWISRSSRLNSPKAGMWWPIPQAGMFPGKAAPSQAQPLHQHPLLPHSLRHSPNSSGESLRILEFILGLCALVNEPRRWSCLDAAKPVVK